jgi:hypothetical protein
VAANWATDRRAAWQHPLLDAGGGLVRQRAGRLDEPAGVAEGELPVLQHGQRLRQAGDEVHRVGHPGRGGLRRDAQNARHVLAHPLLICRRRAVQVGHRVGVHGV